VWYSFGVTHLPRVEDFPVMPVETVGFMMKPYNFFGRWNPTLDVPPDRNAASREELTTPARSGKMAGGGTAVRSRL
jgi:primary-amine oxidase